MYWSDLQKEGLDHWRGRGGNRIVKGGSGVPSLGHCGDTEAGTEAGDRGQLCEFGLVL